MTQVNSVDYVVTPPPGFPWWASFLNHRVKVSFKPDCDYQKIQTFTANNATIFSLHQGNTKLIKDVFDNVISDSNKNYVQNWKLPSYITQCKDHLDLAFRAQIGASVTGLRHLSDKKLDLASLVPASSNNVYKVFSAVTTSEVPIGIFSFDEVKFEAPDSCGPIYSVSLLLNEAYGTFPTRSFSNLLNGGLAYIYKLNSIQDSKDSILKVKNIISSSKDKTTIEVLKGDGMKSIDPSSELGKYLLSQDGFHATANDLFYQESESDMNSTVLYMSIEDLDLKLAGDVEPSSCAIL